MQNTNNKPLISVLVPIYNCGAYLEDCLSSIIKQDYRPIQVVLHNDGSKDNSLEICNKYAAEYNFIEVYSTENRGVASARNCLLDKIRGDYFIFIDADDWIEHDMLSYLYSVIVDNKSDIAVCGKCNGKCNNVSKSICENWDNDKAIREFIIHKRLSGSLTNKLFRTKILQNDRFNCRIHYGEDALFTWELIKKTHSITISNKPLYHYRNNPNSISRQAWSPDIKGTGMIVWDKICEDVRRLYPSYLDLSHSRSALEAMWAIYFASICGYLYDEHIEKRQKYVKHHLSAIRNNPFDGFDKYITAYILCRWYGFGKAIKWIHGFKNIFR